ncbi:MAG: type I restriction enzyme HsdR N-terminal domain-containing protein [Desulfobacteraceae bacterium]|jgi:hypothetical protein
MNSHHLILGRLTDYISGHTLDDTLDERHRQSVGRLLVEQKGYAKAHITSRYALEVRTDNKCARLLITYLVRPSHRIAMLIQYGPGSLVTRHRPALAMSRLVADYQIPVVVVTNGEQADILNGKNGKIINTGLEAIPDFDELKDISARHTWAPISRKRTEMESRILMAFEVDDRCPCDDSTCTIESNTS